MFALLSAPALLICMYTGGGEELVCICFFVSEGKSCIFGVVQTGDKFGQLSPCDRTMTF